MKLYLITDLNRAYSNYNEIDSSPVSDYSVRSSSTHQHENYDNLNEYITYRAFNKNFCRSRYSSFEFPLIDIPDDCTFQLMLLGIQDYDFIVYNHKTKKIFAGTDSYDISMYASYTDDKSRNYPRNGGMSMGNASSINKNKDRFFTFSSDYNEDEVEREVTVEVDQSNGYNEIKEALMPYVIDKYQKDVNRLCSYLNHNYEHIIGRQTRLLIDSGGSCIESADDSCYRVLEVQREDMAFAFISFIEDDEIYLKAKNRIPKHFIEVLRAFSVDILSKYSENVDIIRDK